MFCTHCGNKIEPENLFCTHCGVHADPLPLKNESTPDSSKEVGDATPPVPKSARKRTIQVIFGAVFGLLVLAVSIYFATRLPVLHESDVQAAASPESLCETLFVDSEWANGEGAKLVSSAVTSIEDVTSQGASIKEAFLDAVYQVGAFEVAVTYRATFVLDGNRWSSVDSREWSRTVSPNGKLDNDKIIEHIPAFLESIDNQASKGQTDVPSLKRLYGESLEGMVESSSIRSEDATVLVSISSKKGWASYKGTLLIDLAWNGSDWEIIKCAVDDEAYRADYSSLIGTWIGVYEGVGSWYSNKCYGGESQPATIVIKSVDSTTMTAIVDLGYLVHDHKGLDNPAESSEGDQYVEQKDVLITLKPSSTASFEVYEAESPCKNNICLETDGEGFLMEVWSYPEGIYYWQDAYKMTKKS